MMKHCGQVLESRPNCDQLAPPGILVGTHLALEEVGCALQFELREHVVAVGAEWSGIS